MIDSDNKNTPLSPNPRFRRPGIRIHLADAGKRFNREWIFRNLTHTFETGSAYAITGANGSGKSTLLQAIAGSLQLSEGSIQYLTAEENTPTTNLTIIEPENAYRHLSVSAPYLELIEEMTVREFLHFHHRFKPFIPAVAIDEIIAIIGLEQSADKQMRYYSSGMKQRVKLAQAVFSDTPLLLLDEPCTNLDASGFQLYQSLITGYCGHKLVIVSSNDEAEISFCGERLLMADYK